MRTIVGIDPGKHGGLAFIPQGDRTLMKVYRMPLLGKELFLAQVIYLFEELEPGIAVLEKVGAMPKQGVTSTFTFGMGYGMLRGICAGMKIPLELVTPQQWKGSVLKGTPKDKAAAAAYCTRAYPTVEIIPPNCSVPHTGITDAVCIAEYGLRTYG